MGGGRLRRPPLINYQVYIKTVQKICIKTCQKYAKNTKKDPPGKTPKHQNTYESYAKILSRVGERPSATILHAQFHFWIFAWVFKANIQPKYALLEGVNIP